MNLHESDVMPVQVSMSAIDRPIVVFAPHPDDEVFGCGGLLALAAQKGLAVRVVVLTDGGLQAPQGVDARRHESDAAAAALGYGHVEHWALADRSLRFDEALIERVMGSVSDDALVLAPSLWEAHPDHRVCAMVVAEALRRRGGGAELWFYEVSAPLRASVVLDVSAVWPVKRRAMDAFVSQEDVHPYAESVEGLNRYRALGLTGVVHAEAFERHGGSEALRGWWQSSPAIRLRQTGVPAAQGDLPLLTVMVRTLGRATLERALDSVFNQTYPHIELLVIDATAHPRTLPEGYEARVRRVGGTERLGRSAAANLGLRSANGSWLLFLDDDDWLYPDHLSKLVRASWQNRDVAAFYSDVEGVDVAGVPTGIRFDQAYQARELCYGNFLPIHSVLFSRQLLTGGLCFDEQFDLYEDWDFWLQIETRTTFVRVPGVSAAYCVGSGSGEGVAVDVARGSQATRQIFTKWNTRLDAVAFDELVRRSLEGRQMHRQLAKVQGQLNDAQLLASQALQQADHARQDAHVLRLAHDAACSDRDGARAEKAQARSERDRAWADRTEVQAGLRALAGDLEGRRHDLAQLRSELDLAREERTAVQHQLNLSRVQVEELHGQRDQLNLRVWQSNERLLSVLATEKGLRDDVHLAHMRVDHLTHELEATHRRLLGALQQSEGWQLRFEQVVASRSWWVTKPLRWATRLLDVIRRRGVAGTVRRGLEILGQGGVSGLVQKGEAPAPAGNQVAPGRTYLDWVAAHDRLDGAALAALSDDLAALAAHPLVSVVMPVYNPPEADLVAAIESVRAQLYGNWELCLCDDASTESHVARVLKTMAEQDGRIKWLRHDQNAHISEATNSALTLAKGDFVAFLDHDDVLAPHALLRVVEWFQNHPDHRVVYSDEDKLNPEGQRFDPYFKPDFNLSLLRSHNYMCHFAVYRKELMDRLGGIRKGFEGAQDHDLALRAVDVAGAQGVGHIPHVLYHWRVTPGSTAGGHQQKSYAFQAGQRAIAAHLERRGLAGAVLEAPEAPGMYRVKWTIPEQAPLVSIVIPTRNGEALLRKCLDSLRQTAYPAFEIIVIDNGSDDAATLRLLEERQAQGQIRVLNDPSPFNYSQLNNRAVREVCQGEFVLLMNNDIEITHESWLDEMVGCALEEGVGCVGARLWYPDGRLQHGGVIMVCGVAGHAHKYLPRGQHGYMGRAVLAQEFLAVTAACLLVRRDVYLQVDGLDESLKVAFNDVDFCLRVHAAGFRNVWTPYAELIHHESVTRGHEDTPEKQTRFAGEVAILQARWPEWIANDPCYSPNLTDKSEDFSWAWPPRRRLP